MNQENKGSDSSSPVASILDQLEDRASECENVTIGDMMDALGNRSYGPFLMIPALIGITPVGGIPGVPTLLAVIIILFAVQIMLGLDHLWIPKFLRKRRVPADKMKQSLDAMRPWAVRMDRWFRGRLDRLTAEPFVQIAAGACVLLALAIPPLELLPFAVALPALAIAMFGLALLVSDGILMLVASAFTGLAVAGGLGFVGPNWVW
ncbi:Exopolysaccharide synthesis, ExoD [Methyloligella halotolerans]|uniref:Exopolysaccharide synthesis, ExoD n=1 Tax=Methyloligella halotolerans TaxID=1177755 RepID=A0A1E2RWI3_9HYPH|nr:exopolysaccharide biosynthesis protein [Methyloligella halotolerans]ODA66429.1 Exopolysaccharide synthesis, ExoD [Methyloligella halotolerans]